MVPLLAKTLPQPSLLQRHRALVVYLWQRIEFAATALQNATTRCRHLQGRQLPQVGI